MTPWLLIDYYFLGQIMANYQGGIPKPHRPHRPHRGTIQEGEQGVQVHEGPLLRDKDLHLSWSLHFLVCTFLIGNGWDWIGMDGNGWDDCWYFLLWHGLWRSFPHSRRLAPVSWRFKWLRCYQFLDWVPELRGVFPMFFPSRVRVSWNVSPRNQFQDRRIHPRIHNLSASKSQYSSSSWLFPSLWFSMGPRPSQWNPGPIGAPRWTHWTKLLPAALGCFPQIPSARSGSGSGWTWGCHKPQVGMNIIFNVPKYTQYIIHKPQLGIIIIIIYYYYYLLLLTVAHHFLYTWKILTE